MSSTFGDQPGEVVTSSRGDVLEGVSLSLYPTSDDAVAGTNLLTTVVTNVLGRWSYTHATLIVVWVRTPDGQVYSVEDQTATAAAVTAEAALARVADNLTSGTVADARLPVTAQAATLSSTFARARQVDAKVYGATGDGVTDDTTAIQAAITAAGPGGTVLFPPTSSFYLVTPGSLTVTTANLRLLGTPRDGYAVSIRATSGTGPILTVKAAGFVYQDIGILGNGGVNGVGATMDGIDLFGDTSATMPP